jgi:hypothetical protein
VAKVLGEYLNNFGHDCVGRTPFLLVIAIRYCHRVHDKTCLLAFNLVEALCENGSDSAIWICCQCAEGQGMSDGCSYGDDRSELADDRQRVRGEQGRVQIVGYLFTEPRQCHGAFADQMVIGAAKHDGSLIAEPCLVAVGAGATKG